MVFEAAAPSPTDWMRAGIANRVFFIPVSVGALDAAVKMSGGPFPSRPLKERRTL
jgi:hypothetical protein